LDKFQNITGVKAVVTEKPVKVKEKTEGKKEKEKEKGNANVSKSGDTTVSNDKLQSLNNTLGKSMFMNGDKPTELDIITLNMIKEEKLEKEIEK